LAATIAQADEFDVFDMIFFPFSDSIRWHSREWGLAIREKPD